MHVAKRQWRVERYSGRGAWNDSAQWTTKFRGTEAAARARFEQTRTTMRRGGVRLYAADGSMVAQESR